MFENKFTLSTTMYCVTLTYGYSKKLEQLFSIRLRNVLDVLCAADYKLIEMLSIDLQSKPTNFKVLDVKDSICFESYSLASFKAKNKIFLFTNTHPLIDALTQIQNVRLQILKVIRQLYKNKQPLITSIKTYTKTRPIKMLKKLYNISLKEFSKNISARFYFLNKINLNS